MEIVNKQDKKSKAFAISSIMKNPDLAKTISASWDAPIGSTKNNKAKAILNSIYRINTNFNIQDGKGGAGLQPYYNIDNVYNPTTGGEEEMMTSQYNDQSNTDTSMDPNRSTSFIPTVDNLMSSMGDTQKGETSEQSKDKLLPTEGAPTVLGDLGTGLKTMGDFSWEFAKKIPSAITRGLGNMERGYGAALNNTLATANNYYREKYYPGKYKKEEWIKIPDMFEYTSPSDTKKQTELNQQDNVSPTMNNDNIKTEAKSRPTGEDEIAPGGLAGEKDTSGIQEKEPVTPDMLFNSSPDVLNKWYDGLDAADKSTYSELYNAVTQGIGPEAWALKVMNDKNIMTKLGLPQVTIDMFPQGSSLTANLQKLWETKKDEYKLDSQLDMLLKMQNQSNTIKNDLTTYIRGKDDYLQKIEDLKTDAQTDYAYSDTSDPYVAQRASNYLNYLTILEGRQQGRYDNFLKLATDSNTAQMKQMQNLYDSTYAKAKEAYNFEAGITKESYDNIKNMLKDMYNNLDAQEEKLRDKERFDWERKENAANLSIKTAQLEGLKNKTVINSDNYNKYDEKLVHNTLFHSYDKDNAVNDFDTYDPAEIVNGAIRNKINPQDAFNEYLSLHKKDLENRLSMGDSSTLNKYINEIEKYNALYNDYKKKTKLSDTDKIRMETARDYSIKLSELLSEVNRRNYSELIKKIPTERIRTMVEDLTGKGLFNTEEKEKNKKSFIKKYSKNINEKNLATILFDKYQIQKMANSDYKEELNSILKNSTDEDFITSIKNLVN